MVDVRVVSGARFLALIVLLGALLGGRQAAADGERVTSSGISGLQVLRSDGDGILLELNTPDYVTASQEINGNVYQFLSVPGYSTKLDPGNPQLPVMVVLIGAPMDAQVHVRVVAEETVPLGQSFRLPLAPYPAPIQDDTQRAEWYPVDETMDAPGVSGLYPADFASVTGDAWLRDQRIIRLELSPFQYHPMDGALLWHPRIQVEVMFDGGVRDSAVPGVGASLEVDAAFEAVLEQSLLNYDIARDWRAMPEAGFIRETSVWGPRLRVVVTEDGLYRISYQQLVDAGWITAEVDPQMLHMSNQGRDVAIYVHGEDDGVFDPDDYILFYGEAFRGEWMASWYADEADLWINYVQQRPDGSSVLWHPEFTAAMMEKYTLENVYWLLNGTSQDQPRMGELDGTPGSAYTPTSYRTTQRSEVVRARWEYHYTSEDTWFWRASIGDVLSYPPVNLSAISPNSFIAEIRAEVVALNYNNNLSPDHHTKFWINNRVDPIDDAYWDGRSRYALATEVPSTDLLEGANTVKFQALTGAASPPWIYYDWFEIEYDRLYQAYENTINFPGNGAGTWRYAVGGFSEETLYVIDVTDPLTPARVLNVEVSLVSPGAYQGAFQLTHGDDAEYYIASPASIKVPDAISFYSPPDLRSSENGADYLIIAHPDFLAESQTLANYRASQGLRTLVVNVFDIYNEFNEGIYHPIAVKNFLRYTFANWQPPIPRYVILVGDGHWNTLGANPTNYGMAPVFMPPNLSWVDAWQGEVDSANQLATIVGSDPVPDISIGRIPVSNAAQLSVLIAKIIQYEASPVADWQRNNLFVTDNTPDSAGDFVAQAEEIISDHIPSAFSALRVYTNDYKNVVPSNCGTSPYPGGPSCPNVNAAITNALNGPGAQFVSYIGHGAVQRWAGEQIWLYHPDDPSNPNDMYYSDFDNLTNQGMLPIVLSMTCLDGYWFHPSQQPSLAEVFLWTPNTGAVATFSPTGLGVSTGHDVLQRGFYDAVYQSGVWELGAATTAGKVALYNFSSYTDLMHTYNLYGDPALRMLSPYDLDLSPEETHLSALAGSMVTYTLMLTNTGTITDKYDVMVSGNTWQTSLSFLSITLLPGQGSTFTATVDIPAGVSGGTTDIAQVLVVSRGDRNQVGSSGLETTANVYGVSVNPSSSALIGLPGSVVTYTLGISNTSNTTDTFTITATNGLWPTTPSLMDVGPLPSGGSATIVVEVEIPATAQNYDMDQYSLLFVSQADSLRTAVARMTTTARTFGIDLSPSSQYGSGRAGNSVTYWVWVENTGGYPDSFDIVTTSDMGWTVTPATTTVGSLTPGDRVGMNITVDIPADAIAGAFNTTTVRATSQSQASYQDSGLLYTTANVYGLSLFAPVVSAWDLPGNTVTYTVTLTNLSNMADEFDLDIGLHDWETTVSYPNPQVIGGGDVDVVVQVSIPAGAAPYQIDSITLQWFSRADPTRSAQVVLTTIARVGGFLPMLYR